MGNLCVKKKKKDYLLKDSVYATPSPESFVEEDTESLKSGDSRLEFRGCTLYSGDCDCDACKNICRQCYYVFNECICNQRYYDTS